MDENAQTKRNTPERGLSYLPTHELRTLPNNSR